MKSIIFHSAIAEITAEDFQHPGLRLCKFVFCDDQPNGNGQGIRKEDFAEIKKSAIGTPFKMKFLGQTPAGHLGSIPIGYIRDIWEEQSGDVNQLIGVATLFADEFPEEVEWIHNQVHQAAAADEEGPGVSFEVQYGDSLIENGVEWLKKMITKAATIVRNPAYGNRTAILALASNRNISENALIDAIAQIHNDTNDTTDEGGNTRMDEKELEEAKAEIKRLTEALAAKDAEIDVLSTKATTLETSLAEKDNTIASYQKQELVQTRVDALAAIGFEFPSEEEKLTAKTKFIGDLTEEAFAEYKEDLEAVLAKSKEAPKDALASLRQPVRVPKLAAASTSEQVSVLDLKEKFAKISRSHASSDSE